MIAYGVWFITHKKELDGEPFTMLEGLFTSEEKANQTRDMLNARLEADRSDFREDDSNEFPDEDTDKAYTDDVDSGFDDDDYPDVDEDYQDHYEVWPAAIQD